MKKIFTFALLASIALNASTAFGCDEKMRKFPRDCQIQDRLIKLKADFQEKGVDLDEVAEYRVMRFIQRPDWENAKRAKKSPEFIYNPAPATWQVWDQGIRRLFKADGSSTPSLNKETLSDINKAMLTNDAVDVRSSFFNPKKQPGEARNPGDELVGAAA